MTKKKWKNVWIEFNKWCRQMDKLYQDGKASYEWKHQRIKIMELVNKQIKG